MDDNNSDVVNEVDDLDDVLSETDGKIDIYWYEEAEISLVCINNELLNEYFLLLIFFMEKIIILL